VTLIRHNILPTGRRRAPRVRRGIGATLAVGALIASSGAELRAQTAGLAPTLYTALREAELEYVGTIQEALYRHDQVEFTIVDAELYLTEPVAGIRTGAVLLGAGRIRVTPPNAVERQQLEKYIDASALDLEFKKAVLRFGGRGAEELASLADPGGGGDLGEAKKQYRDRHKKFLEEQMFNLDSRVLMDLIDERDGPAFFAADVDAKGWLSIAIDPREREEVRIYKSHGSDRQQDIWSMMHAARDDAPDGRRSAQLGRLRLNEHWAAAFEVPQLAVDLLLDDDDDIEAVATLRLTALADTRVAQLAISPVLEVTAVHWNADSGPWPPARDSTAPDELPALTGAALQFVQEKLGRGMREDMYDRRVIVPLPRLLRAGETIRLNVRYRGELIQKLADRQFAVRDPSGWFPQHPDAKRSQFSTTFRTPDEHRVASGGEITFDEVVEGTRVASRTIPVPTIGMSFHYGKLEPYVDSVADWPTFTVYASSDSRAFNPGRRDDTITDLRNALELFTEYFGPAPFDSLVITETPATAAWAFQGFLMMPYTTFAGMHTGEAEMFRSHELAHQWWGNSVTWETYHDVWLSEGFASYCAALYAQRGLDDEDQFVDMMQAWAKDILRGGDVAQRVGTKNYGFPREFLRKSRGSESGPIWLGERLTSDKTPPDYRLLVYEKGAFVLHMLRMLRYDWETGDDAPFRDLMQTFQSRYRGAVASTEDFLDVVEEIYGEDMLWFFDQWVYGTDIPEYRPDLEPRLVDGVWRLQGTIEQRETNNDFRMPLPVRVQLKDGTSQVVVVHVSGTGVTVDEALRGAVDEIEVNPLEAVLANVR
jgi:hypothetical protein